MKAKVVDEVQSIIEKHKTKLIIAGSGVIFVAGFCFGYRNGGLSAIYGLYQSFEKVDPVLFKELITKGIEQGATIRW